jgi:membrane-associated protease RseP (regulator of RpoE activity)
MRVTEFFAGFGPRLWSTKVGETEYGIKAYPLGGYVKIPGMNMYEEVDPAHEARSYRAATFPRRLLVVSAGSIMHFLLAFVLAWALIVFVGQTVAVHTGVSALPSWVGYGTTPAKAAGLERGDVIVAVNGTALSTMDQLTAKLQHSVDHPVTLTVDRGSKTMTITVVPVNGRNIAGAGKGELPATGPPVGFIGIETTPVEVNQRHNALAAVPAAAALVGHVSAQIISNIVHLFSPSGVSGIAHNVANPSQSLNPGNVQNRPMSLVGIVRLLMDEANHHPAKLLGLFMLVNISFGILNMLPMLPLDGGHAAVAVYERARTRKGEKPYRADVNKLAPVVYAFMAALVMLFLSALYLDIVHPIG